MKNFEIKVTGSGTQNQILTRLYDLVRLLEGATDSELEDYSAEDDILYTEITSDFFDEYPEDGTLFGDSLKMEDESSDEDE